MTPKGEDDDDLDDASLRSMRAVWLSMRDEEPPAAGMSALLAAAAEKAEHMRDASQPWWQRAFALLRRPPALAFATVMILIGGAVLVTRTNDKKTASEVATAPALESRDVSAGAGSAAIAPAIDEPAEESVQEEKAKLSPEPPPAVVAKPPAVKRGAGTKAKPTEPTKPEPSRHDRFDSDAPKLEAQPGVDRGASSTQLQTPGRAKTPDKPAVREQTETTIDVGGAAAPAQDSEVPADPKVPATKQPPSSIEQLARQAESAAARGDCAAVKTIVARIKQQDAAFFKTRLGTSAAVAKCL